MTMDHENSVNGRLDPELAALQRESFETFRMSEERLRLALQGADEQVWDWNLVSGEIIASPALEELLGYERIQTEERFAWWKRNLHSDDIALFNMALKDYVDGVAESYSVEYRIRDIKGEWRWFWSKGKCVERDSLGRPVRLLGTQVDVTEKKYHEEGLRQSIRQLEQQVSFVVQELQEARGKLNDELCKRKSRDQVQRERDALERLADESQEFIFIVDHEGRLSYVNGYGARFLETTPKDLLGKQLKEIFPPDAVRFQGDAIRKVFETGEGALVEDSVTFAIKGGCIETRLVPIREGDAIVSVLGMARDITGRKKIETALRESESRYRSLLDTVPHGIQTSDIEGRITFSNPAHHRILGYHQGELIGRFIWDFIENDEEREYIKQYYQKIVTERPDPLPTYVKNRTRDGRRITIRVDWDYMYDARGKVIGINSVISDMSDIKRTEDALRGSEERLRILTDSLPMLIAYVDTDQRYRFTNNQYKIWVQQQTLYGRRVRDIIGEENYALISGHIEAALSGKNVKYQTWLKYPKGERRFVEVNYIPDFGSAGEVKGFFALISDFTGLKLVEEQLKIKDKAIDTSVNAMIFIDIWGNISYVNDSVLSLWGYEREELLGHPITEFAYDPPRLRQILQDIRTERGWQGELQTRRKDGSLFHIYLSANTVEDAEGQTVLLMGSIIDITEEKKAREALQQAKDHLQALYDASPDMIFLHASDGRLLDVNDNVLKNYGFTHEEMITLSPQMMMGEGHTPEMAFERIRKALEGELQCFEWLARNKCGDEFPVEVRLKRMEPSFNGGHPGPYVIAVVRDITERKQVEMALRESEERYRAIVEDQTEFICRTKADGVTTFVNDAICRLFGKSRKELIDKSFFPLLPEEDLARLKEGFNAFTPDKPVFTLEHRLIIPHTGEVRWMQWTNRAIYDESNNIREFQAVGRDITERKEMEEELLVSRFSFDRATETIFLVDSDARFVYVNEAACASLGYSKDELSRKKLFDVDPLYSKENWPQSWNALRAMRSLTTESTHRRKDGTEFPVEVTTDYFEFGERKYACSFVRDITWRRDMENELIQSERKFRQFAELLPQIVFETDERGFFTFVNKRALELTGYTAEDIASGLNCIATLAPEDQELATKNMMDVMRGELSLGNEYTMVRKDGKTFPVIVYSSRIMNGDKVAGIRGIVVDITMVREAEEEKDRLFQEVKDALSNVKMLSGLLPICSSCKKIRDEAGYWKKLESFISEHSDVSFSFHTCPECSAKLYPGKNKGEWVLPSLTAREKEVLQWVRQGKSNWEIAAILGISERTVKYHVSGILNKLDVVTRAQAVSVALELGIIED